MGNGSATRIYGFVGEFSFLQTGYRAPITVQGLVYPTVLHALLAARTTDLAVRKQIAGVDAAADAARIGMTVTLRADWSTIAEPTMLFLQRAKFKTHPALGTRLLDTGEAELVNASRRGDERWGVDYETGRGQNLLGRILMNVRGELLRDYAERHLPHAPPPTISPEQQLLGGGIR